MRDGIDARFELVALRREAGRERRPRFDAAAEALAGAAHARRRRSTRSRAELVAAHRARSGRRSPCPSPATSTAPSASRARSSAARPSHAIALGGGYVNTELRGLRDPRVFDYFDYVTLDDGERPLLALIEHLRASSARAAAVAHLRARRRTRWCCRPTPTLHDVPHADAGTPTYDGLPLADYVSLLEMLNPMHRLWSDGRWNKLTLAHGCYWKKCTFCDISLDYIGRYETASADLLVDRIEALIAETGADGLSLRRRGRAAGGPARAGRAAHRAQRGDHLVGQHPLREDLHARAGAAAGALGLRRGDRRAGGGLRSAARRS